MNRLPVLVAWFAVSFLVGWFGSWVFIAGFAVGVVGMSVVGATRDYKRDAP